MKKEAVEHLSSSRYCFPLDEHTYLIRIRVAKNDDINKVHLLYNEWFSFYKKQIDLEMTRRYEDDLFSFYEARISSKNPTFEYFFRFDYGNDLHIDYLQSGFHEVANISELGFDEFFAPFINKADLIGVNPIFNGGLIYQIFPDRFEIGKKDKDMSYVSLKDGDKMRNDAFYGGDLVGIKNRLDYLSSIGVEAIYLTPIHPSRSAHKYDVEDYFKIDPHFGDENDLKALVDEAHSKGIKIILDMVFNHASFYSNLMQDVVKNGINSKYYDWFFIDGEYPDIRKKNYKMFANQVGFMPKLNSSNPEVIEYFKSVVCYYAYNYKVDGFRLDVSYEVSHEFWIKLKLALKEINPNIIFIGEYWLNSESFLSSHEWDSVMNYPFRLVLTRFLNEEKDVKYLKEELTKLYLRYADPINLNMVNLFDSHDVLRFYTYLNKDFNKYLTSLALLIAYPGMPEIYYGSEILLEGYDDPDNRRIMKWDSPLFSSYEFEQIKTILLLRKNAALRKGEVDFFYEDDVFILEREYESNCISFCLSRGQMPKKYYKEKEVLFSYLNEDENDQFSFVFILENH